MSLIVGPATPAAARPEPATPWPLRDYVSPGLVVVRPDDAFPHLRPGDMRAHPWKYLRRDVPHLWYVDDRFPLMGVLNRDEATLLHNIALRFAGGRALEIGAWLGWSTCHLALAGVEVDVIDPAHEDPERRAIVEASLARCGVADRVRLHGGRSPETVARAGGPWRLFFVDGDHEGAGPLRDVAACLPHAAGDCAFVFHDVAAPPVAAAVRLLRDRGFQVLLYQTAQIMALAWRGDVAPVPHVPDPDVAWQVPAHLLDLPIAGHEPQPEPRVHRRLSDALDPSVVAQTDAASPSVCIVTSELVGPFKNGGIGTAMTGLAETLAGHGLAVTVLYTGGVWAPDVGLSRWKAHFARRGITFVPIDFAAFADIAGPLRDRGFGVPWFVYRFLREHRFDVVHFNDCCGEGSLCLAAKRLGIGFHDSLLTVALHSPSRWVLALNHMPPSNVVLSAFDHAERVSVACTDVLWSPSRYMLDWAAAQGFELPAQTFVQPYAIPGAATAPSDAAPASAPLREIVFFGRLEERKGLRVFCAAVDRLREAIAARGITVTFLGKPEHCDGVPSLDYIARRGAAWTFPVRTITDLGQPEALRHLSAAGTLAVIASPIDNSPCTLYEALDRGIPFLAARTGGIPELIAAADQDRVLFDPTPDGLSVALSAAMANGARTARPAIAQQDTRRTWTAMHDRWRAFLPATPDAVALSSVAVIIDHRAGDRLDLTLASTARCPTINRLIVLNRDGDTLPLDSLDPSAGDPAMLAAALADVTEDAVLLLHSGVALLPEAFPIMVAALGRHQIDGLQPAGRVPGQRRALPIPPLGGSAAFGLFEGATFTGALLLRRASLLAATAGRPIIPDAPFLGLADHCAAHAPRIWPYPEVVVEMPEGRPIAPRGVSAGRAAAYADAAAIDRYSMLAVGYASANQPQPLVSKMQLATAAAGLGLSSLVRVAVWGRARLRRLVR